MRCTVKKTLETIIESKNEYVITVKKNKKKLYGTLEKSCCTWKDRKDYYCSSEKNKGRLEKRKIYVYQFPPGMEEQWPGAKEIVKATRIRDNESKTWYYISSMQTRAKKYSEGIRGHWGIENKLHWVKDAIMLEDRQKTKHKNAGAVMSIFSSIVLNIIREQNRNDCKNFMEMISCNIEQMRLLIE